MRIGDLRHRVTIQKLITETNENGFETEVWIDLKTNVWASVSNLSGREFWAAKAVQSENTVEFGIRYAQFVESMDSRTYRIKHGTRIYNITSIDNYEFRKTFVTIKTLEMVS